MTMCATALGQVTMEGIVKSVSPAKHVCDPRSIWLSVAPYIIALRVAEYQSLMYSSNPSTVFSGA